MRFWEERMWTEYFFAHLGKIILTCALISWKIRSTWACEVGGAYSLTECWKLVEAYERTKTPVMLMENCVYGRNEMMAAHMAEQGALGKIVHCEVVIAMICGKDWHSARKIVIIALPIISIEMVRIILPMSWDQLPGF